MQKLKTQKGITLIALIITIIVMLILVGVSVTVALDGGLFSTAQDATGKTQIASDKEQLLGAVMGGMGSGGKINFDNVTSLPEGFTADQAEGVKADTTRIYEKAGKEYIVNERGSIGEKEYTIGQEITLDGENFFVIGEDADTVTLLAKYNLNTEGTAQLNAANSDEIVCAFSSTNYWSSETSYPLNLNDYTIPEDATSIVTTAKTYGVAKGGTGRLMTYEEANELKTNYAGIIYGTSIDATDGYLCYWLGSAIDDEGLWSIEGFDNSLFDDWYYYDIVCGVRPVVEISKSSIS